MRHYAEGKTHKADSLNKVLLKLNEKMHVTQQTIA